MNETVLQTINLTKKFKNKVAVDKVNITLCRGDIYGFIGRNGAGKTTAMRLILGLAFPDEGDVVFFGGEEKSKARKKIGSLIEAPGIYKSCSAYENMKRFSILYGGTDEDIKRNLELVGLSDTGNKKVGQFSLGMKQRLGIAIALLGNPEIMVLDEPVNGLDPEGIKEIRDCILRLKEEKGVTFLISSHLLDELAKIVTKYGIINDGRLVEEIAAEELEKRCESGLKIIVDDGEKAEEILRSRFPELEIKRKSNELILPNITENSGKYNALLVKSGVSVEELGFLSGGLENYFIERLGK